MEAVLIAGGLDKGLDDELIEETLQCLRSVTGANFLALTSVDLKNQGIGLGPRTSLAKKIRELNGEVGTRHERF